MVRSFEHLCLLAFIAILNLAKAANDFTSLQEYYVVGKEFTVEWTSVTGYIQAFSLVYESDYDDFVPDLIQLDCDTLPKGCQYTPNNGSLRYTPTKEGKDLVFLLWWSPIIERDPDRYPISRERLSTSEIFDFVTQEQADVRSSSSSSSVVSRTQSSSVSRPASTATSSSSGATPSNFGAMATSSSSGPTNLSASSNSQQTGAPSQQSSGGGSNKLSGGAIAGIAIGVVALLLLGIIAALLWRRQRNRPQPQQDDTGTQSNNEKPTFKSELEGGAGLSPHNQHGGVSYNTTPAPAPAYPGSGGELQRSEGDNRYSGVAASELPVMSGNISNVAELDGVYHGQRQ